MLRLYLFGAPRIEQDGQSVPLRRTKALALLTYLAVTGQPQEREALLTLLWPEFDEASARNNLRRELSLIKTILHGDVLVTDRQQIAWNTQLPCWLDVAMFQGHFAKWRQHAHPDDQLCDACAAALSAAVQLGSADFMSGFSLPPSAAFDEWQFFQRETLRQQLATGLQALGRWHGERGEHSVAIGYARRWVALDELHEPAQRTLMEQYAWAGQHSAALRQYEECARLLERQLGAEPEGETQALGAALRTRQLRPAAPVVQAVSQPAPGVAPLAETPHPAPPTLAPQHQLPPQVTPFVGREPELAVLDGYLHTEAMRLVTIVGAGGMGKTRLAIELAARQRGSFADGVVFVALQPLHSADLLVSALAAAVGCPLSGTDLPLAQLLDHLSTRQMLLLLDNFEHLLDGVDLLGTLLAAAPGLRLLVTSREVLNLQEEWCYPLQGLDVPPLSAGEQLERYTAVQFFVERARRVRPDFSFGIEQESVVRICRLVEGMPLALELAAVWTKTLACQVIASEIAHNLQFLVTRLRNVPERHRSVRAVFDYSWALLSPAEQAVFAQLAVFRGGFLPEAAVEITGAALPILADLVDKSLLRVASGRYTMHELLRQYAQERLDTAADEAARVRAAHADYYLRFMVQHTEAAASGREGGTPAIIATDMDNIRLAWQHAIEHAEVAAIRMATMPLLQVWFYHGHYHEGIAASERATASLRHAPPSRLRDVTLAEVLTGASWLYIRIGQLAQARAMLVESYALYEQSQEPPTPGQGTHPLAGLATLAMIDGDYVEAARLGELFLRHSQAHQHTQNLAFAWNTLAQAALAQGLYSRAHHAVDQAYAAVQVVQDRWYSAYVLNELGHVALAQGRYAEAGQHYQASYAIREEFNDPDGMAIALISAAKLALRQEDYGQARALYERGLAIYRTSGDRGGLALALHGIGRIATALGERDTAGRCLHEALGLARDIQFVPLMLAILVAVGELFVQSGRQALAGPLLVLVVRHPATDREHSEQAQQLLVQHERALAVDAATMPAIERSGTLDLNLVVEGALITLDG